MPEFDPNLRLKIQATGLRTYPDVSVYCKPYEFDPEDRTGQTMTNPVVLIEVLSPSTEAYDRGLKAQSYRQIESLKAYALVSQNEAHVEMYERQGDGLWVFREVRGLKGTLTLSAIGVDLPLADIYGGVEFTRADGTEHSVQV